MSQEEFTREVAARRRRMISQGLRASLIFCALTQSVPA